MRGLFLFLVLCLLAACSDSSDSPVAVSSEQQRVVVVYMMAENSLSAAAASDLAEIRAGARLIPAGSTMVVFFDNSDSGALPQILSFGSSAAETVDYTYDSDVVSTDSATMVSVLRRIVSTHPSAEYALVLWSHGSGWVPASSERAPQRRSIGVDNGSNTASNNGQKMDITTLRGVLEQVGVVWKYIFYDACFMQCIEVAYELRQVAEWSIGSPAEIPSEGADYALLMPYFFSRNTFAHDLAEQYYNIYKNNDGVLLSAICSSELDNLAAATRAALSAHDTFPRDSIQQYCAYNSGTMWKPEYYDLASSLYHWCRSDEYAVWAESMERAIPSRYYTATWRTEYTSSFTPRLTDGDHYAGASLYVPVAGRDALNAAWRTYAWYAAAGYLLDE